MIRIPAPDAEPTGSESATLLTRKYRYRTYSTVVQRVYLLCTHTVDVSEGQGQYTTAGDGWF